MMNLPNPRIPRARDHREMAGTPVRMPADIDRNNEGNLAMGIHNRNKTASQRLRGRNLAHASRGARERAALAVAWMRGDLEIVTPTAKQASVLFQVSIPTLNVAIRETKEAEADAALRAAAWLKPLRSRSRINELV
jgi:hypothetical protein